MEKRPRRLNPATVIAVIALVFALSGTAVAAKRYLITNPKQISPAVLKKLATLASREVKNGAPGAAGSAGAAGSSGERGPAGPGAVVYWAVVEANGNVNRHGTGGVTANRVAEGTYVVDFEGDVSKCGYEAVIGLPGDEDTSDPGFATVVRHHGDPNGVFIQTYDNSEETPLADKGFHLAVFC